MKHLLLAAGFTAISATASAQADYKPILQSTFTAFDTTYADMTAKAALGNKLVLIAKKYPDQWAPQFYAAYSRVQLSYFEENAEKHDAILDESENYLADAVRLLGKENTETEVLAATIANSRIGVAPLARYQKYGMAFNDHLDKAKEMNPDNPRVYLQRGISKFYTPKMFGGGKKAAKPYFDKAGELFAKEAGGDVDKPYWGKVTLAYFLRMMQGDDKEDGDKK